MNQPTEGRCVRALLVLLWTLFSLGCSTTNPVHKLDPAVIYKMDMNIINGQVSGEGVIMVDLREKQDFVIETPGEIDLLKITTCHRQEVVTAQKKTVFRYSYLPSAIEKDRRCHIRFEAYEKGGRHSFGMIDFKIESNLKAQVQCNGESKEAFGSAICQSWQGLTQKVEFESPVEIASSDSHCRIPMSRDTINWEFDIRRGECVYAFQELGGQGRLFKLTTVGYEEVAIRVP